MTLKPAKYPISQFYNFENTLINDFQHHPFLYQAGPIVESKGMHAISQKKGKKMFKKGKKGEKYLKIWAKMYKI